jgi:NAD(P)-dependent dehydrogenase (short-subunit alcohol dehydrogenase family)
MEPDVGRSCLVLGGFGTLGAAIASELAGDGFNVLRTTRGPRPEEPSAVVTGEPVSLAEVADRLPRFEAVVWAQGANASDSLGSHGADLARVMDANVASVARTMAELVQHDLLQDGARLVVLSSIWERLARGNKFSYTVSKAALGGLVRAAAADLAPRGILVNAVLPGVVDTPMTRSALTSEQIMRVTEQTPTGRLVTPTEVGRLVGFLCSRRNTAMTGQSVVLDLGFSLVRAL